MFGLFKSKSIEVFSPVKGRVVELESVDDEVFSAKMVGDGVAIIPSDGNFLAPIDGELIKVFSTKHAYIVRHRSSVEIMVHIGIDTVSLNGQGFTAVAAEGDEVKAGDTIIRADLGLIDKLGKDRVTPVVVNEMGRFKKVEKKSGDLSGTDLVMEVK